MIMSALKEPQKRHLGLPRAFVNVRNVNVFIDGIRVANECHASKNNLFDYWEQRSMILTSS